MNILVTGSKGFIGSTVSSFLKAQSKVYTPSRTQLDISNYHSLRQYICANKISHVIHAAVSYDENTYLSTIQMQSNLIKCKDMLQRVIYYGSGAEYNREINLLYVDESNIGRSEPTDEYGKAKYEAFKSSQNLKEFINLRLFGVTGLGDSPYNRFIPNVVVKALLGYPIDIYRNRLMSYVDVLDVSNITKKLLSHKNLHHDYNVADRAYNLVELACLVKKRSNSKSKINILNQDATSKSYSGNGDRLSEEIGYTYVKIEKIIDDLIEFYDANIGIIDRERIIVDKYLKKQKQTRD